MLLLVPLIIILVLLVELLIFATSWGRANNGANPRMKYLKEETSLPPIPGGFKLRGECDLLAIKEQNVTIDLGVLPKHGVHSSNMIPRSCKYSRNSTSRGHKQHGVKVRRYGYGENSLEFGQIITSGNEHKILPVRSQASFFRSAFNHVCNKNSGRKIQWRKMNNVDCTKEGELVRLLNLNEQEISSFSFLRKEIVMQSREVRSVMLIDYKCLPKVVNSLCDEHMMSYENMTGDESNSAEGQNYTDYWAMHNFTPFTPFNPFWDAVYERLEDVCCLEFVKTRAKVSY